MPLERFTGTIVDIKKAHELGLEGDKPIAIIAYSDNQPPAWIPLDESSAELGDQVLVTPIEEKVGKGKRVSCTIEPQNSD
jgi:hypothetical protein